MQSDTQTISVDRDWRVVYEFLARPENLPTWAIHFCRDIRPAGHRWLVETPAGPVHMKVMASPLCGVVDFHLSPAPGVELVAASRVIPNGDHAELLFTQFRPPEMTVSQFDGQVSALQEELCVLKSILEGA